MNETIKLVAVILIFGLGVWWGWCLARQYYYKWYVTELKLKDKEHQSQINNMKECFEEDLTDMMKEKDIARQDLNNQYIRILDEVSKATGIDKIELPSFGTVYLNYNEKLRAAMQELNEEI
jgi:hypothetical protein